MTDHDALWKLDPAAPSEMVRVLERDLTDRYGPLIADDALRLVLGYRSMDAFRQALVRKTVPVPVFSIEHRRGKYALSKDVAIWLARQREAAIGAASAGGDINT